MTRAMFISIGITAWLLVFAIAIGFMFGVYLICLTLTGGS